MVEKTRLAQLRSRPTVVTPEMERAGVDCLMDSGMVDHDWSCMGLIVREMFERMLLCSSTPDAPPTETPPRLPMESEK